METYLDVSKGFGKERIDIDNISPADARIILGDDYSNEKLKEFAESDKLPEKMKKSAQVLLDYHNQ